MAEEYLIDITPDGISMNATGFRDRACLKELAEIERMLKDLGIETSLVDQKLKREAMLAESDPQTTRREIRR